MTNQRPTSAPIVLAILALVAYLFFLASDYKRCQQTICRGGLADLLSAGLALSVRRRKRKVIFPA